MIWLLGLLAASAGATALFTVFRRNARIKYPPPESLIIRLPDDVPDRIVPLESVANFRDIGGYLTGAGRRVRRGLVFRSGSLAHLSERDVVYLHQLGLKLVCDLRGMEEVTEGPDRLPADPAPEYLHLPLTVQENRRQRLQALILNPKSIAPMMPEMYTKYMIDGNARLYGGLLGRLAEPNNLPTLIHCTAGKDRTGIAVALLLLVLGVPDEVVVADYSLSNLYYATFLELSQQLVRPVRWLGIHAEDLWPIMVADPETMRTTIAHIREKYGSVEDYLKDAGGLDEAAIARLKTYLLEANTHPNGRS
jgi:protein-tyrosine phosphatase